MVKTEHREQLLEIFNRRVEYRKTDCGCWIVESHKPDTEGYSRIQTVFGRFYIHRLAYELFNGALQLNRVICHTCDETLCINPRHLVQATQRDNMIDKSAKGRGGSTGSKLTAMQRLDILSSNLSSYKLADIHNVTPYAIRYLRSAI